MADENLAHCYRWNMRNKDVTFTITFALLVVGPTCKASTDDVTAIDESRTSVMSQMEEHDGRMFELRIFACGFSDGFHTRYTNGLDLAMMLATVNRPGMSREDVQRACAPLSSALWKSENRRLECGQIQSFSKGANDTVGERFKRDYSEGFRSGLQHADFVVSRTTMLAMAGTSLDFDSALLEGRLPAIYGKARQLSLSTRDAEKIAKENNSL